MSLLVEKVCPLNEAPEEVCDVDDAGDEAGDPHGTCHLQNEKVFISNTVYIYPNPPPNPAREKVSLLKMYIIKMYSYFVIASLGRQL